MADIVFRYFYCDYNNECRFYDYLDGAAMRLFDKFSQLLLSANVKYDDNLPQVVENLFAQALSECRQAELETFHVRYKLRTAEIVSLEVDENKVLFTAKVSNYYKPSEQSDYETKLYTFEVMYR